MQKANKVKAAVDVTKGVNDLLMNNPVTKIVDQMVKDTEKHIRELERSIADIEQITINEGINLLKNSVRVAEHIRNFGIDWQSKKTLWWKKAEAYAKLLKKRDCDFKLQAASVKSLVDDIIAGSTDFMKRGRVLKEEAVVMNKEAVALKATMNKSAESLIKLKKESMKQQRLAHIAWGAAVFMPPFGLIPGIIATAIVEGHTVPQLENKIKNVRKRLESCDKVWDETANVTQKLADKLEVWIAEARELKTQAEMVNMWHGDYVNPEMDAAFAQELLIDSFLELAKTLKEYA